MKPSRIALAVFGTFAALLGAGEAGAGGYRHGYPGYHAPGFVFRGPPVVHGVPAIHGAWHAGIHSGWHGGYHAGIHAHRRHLAGAFTLGVIGGGLAGAAIAHAASPVVSYPPVVYPPPVVYSPPLVVGSGSTVVSSTLLPSTPSVPAQIAAPATIASLPAPTSVAPGEPALGTVYSSLPAACVFEQVNAQPFYRCGSYWYRAQFGVQGAQYIFVAPPRSY